MCEYYHIVPWYNSAEWLKVYEKIYDSKSSLENKVEALKSLLLWKARCPSLPSGIESTLTLLQVYIQDQKTDEDTVNQQVMRLAYSSAIMRFVNHMLDNETAKGTSLYQAAVRLGVPDWIIDLRHDTAHNNNLPSIELLREATQISLDWLHTNYWDKHKTCMQDYIAGQKETHSYEENKVAAVMSLCTSLSICSNSKIKRLSTIPDVELRESVASDVQELFRDHIDLSKLKKVSITSLVNSMNLHASKLLKSNDTTLYVNEALLGEDSYFLSLELLNYLGHNRFHIKKQLNSHYVQCFEVLLTFLHTNNLILDFVVELTKVSQCSDGDSDKSLLAALWVSEILKALNRCNQFSEQIQRLSHEHLANKKAKDLRQLYRHWFPNVKQNELMLDLRKPAPKELSDINFVQPIISAYNPNLIYFITDIINLLEPKLPKYTSDKICKLAELISSPVELSPCTSKVYTVEDLKMSQNPISLDSADSDSDCEILDEADVGDYRGNTSKGMWRVASSEFAWSTCPIGTLPWLNENVVQMES